MELVYIFHSAMSSVQWLYDIYVGEDRSEIIIYYHREVSLKVC